MGVSLDVAAIAAEPSKDAAKKVNNSFEEFLTFVDVLRCRSQHQSNQLAYTFLRSGEAEEQSLTYGELHHQVSAIAAHLQSRLPIGERVLLAYQPGLDFVLSFLACLHAGMVAVPAYPPRKNQNTSRLRSIVQDSSITTALTSSGLGQSLRHFCSQDSLLANLQWIATDQVDLAQASSWQPPALLPEATAFLQYTSGSTGNPKGVVVSHSNLLHNSKVIRDCFGHTLASRGVIWLPPYHDMGLIGGVLQPLYSGFPVVLMSPLDFLQKPLRWLKAVSHYRATTSGGPNFAYDLLVSKAKPEQLEGIDLSAWEVAFTGAEPIRAETIDKFAETFAPYGFRREAFFPCYGMAESTLIISGGVKLTPPLFCHVDAWALEQNQIELAPALQSGTRTLASCGQSVSDQVIEIVHPDQLTPCTEGQIGEIWVSGPSIAQGYWNRPDQSTETFNACLPGIAGKSFLRTGDLGFIHDGNLFVTGRIKDLIIIRGQNHYPQDIELTAEKSHPILRPNSGAAFSVDVKGIERLVIVYEVERSALRQIDADSVFKQIRQAITAEHSLDLYAAVLVKTGSIPKTSSGKIRRRACHDAFLNGTLNIVKDWSQNPEHLLTFKNLQAEVDSVLQQFLGEGSGKDALN